MENSNRNTTLIANPSQRGVYLWELPNGAFLADQDSNYLSIDAWVGDLEAIRKLRASATYYGYPEGKPKFWPGRSKVTQSEYEDQMAAFIEGDEIPGDYDV